MADDPKGPRPTREEIIAALAAATDPDQDPDSTRSRIVIKPDGQVLIENLSVDLMELALLLDPTAEIGCEIPPGDQDGPSEGG